VTSVLRFFWPRRTRWHYRLEKKSSHAEKKLNTHAIGAFARNYLMTTNPQVHTATWHARLARGQTKPRRKKHEQDAHATTDGHEGRLCNCGDPSPPNKNGGLRMTGVLLLDGQTGTPR
jgi:hypothetical protein